MEARRMPIPTALELKMASLTCVEPAVFDDLSGQLLVLEVPREEGPPTDADLPL